MAICIHIKDGGAVVEPLEKKTFATTTTYGGTYGGYSNGLTKDEYNKAATFCEHSGIGVGSKVKFLDSAIAVGEVLEILPYHDTRVALTYHREYDNEPKDKRVSFIRVRRMSNIGTSYCTTVALCELNLNEGSITCEC